MTPTSSTTPAVPADAVLIQLTDPDDQPVACSCRACGRDAVFVARIHTGTPQEAALTGCRDHTRTLIAAALDATRTTED